jgi:hypothetical protein
MASIPDDPLQEVLRELEDGDRVRLILDDASEHHVIVRDGELIAEESGQAIARDSVRQVLVDSTLGGPE